MPGVPPRTPFFSNIQFVVEDVDGNCVVDVDDLIAVILAWGQRVSPADVNGDGIVDVDDLIMVILNWSV